MTMSTMLINAFHPKFEDRKEPFNGIGMNSVVFKRYILSCPVLHKIMFAKILKKATVLCSIISKHTGFAINVGFKERQQGFEPQIINHDAFGLSGGAIYEGKHFLFMPITRFLFLAFIAPDKGLINFYRTAF